MAFGAYSSPACQACGCTETSCENCQTIINCSNCASCCCSSIHQSWRHGRIGNGIRGEYFSSGWMTIEVLGSIGVGLLAGSFALLAFGGDSLIEMFSRFATSLHLKGDSAGSNGLGDKTERGTLFLLVGLIAIIGAVARSSSLAP